MNKLGNRSVKLAFAFILTSISVLFRYDSNNSVSCHLQSSFFIFARHCYLYLFVRVSQLWI